MEWKFIEYLKTGPWINSEEYSSTVLIVFMIGCVLWLVAYAGMFVHAKKTKTIEYPYYAQANAFAWEIWFGLGIIKVTNMGAIFQVAYFLWFFFDCFLLYKIWTLGKKQEMTESGQKSFHFKYVLVFLFWLVLWYPFMMEYDDSVGAFSGWLCNNIISTLFIFQKLKDPKWGTSRLIAYAKFFGTACCSIVVWTHFYGNKTLVALVFLFAALDIIYIYLVHKGPTTKEILATEPAVA